LILSFWWSDGRSRTGDVKDQDVNGSLEVVEDIMCRDNFGFITSYRHKKRTRSSGNSVLSSWLSLKYSNRLSSVFEDTHADCAGRAPSVKAEAGIARLDRNRWGCGRGGFPRLVEEENSASQATQ